MERKKIRDDNVDNVGRVKISFADDEAANIKMIVQEMILNAYWSRVLKSEA